MNTKIFKNSQTPSFVVISTFILYIITVAFIKWWSSIGGYSGTLADIGYFLLSSFLSSLIIIYFGLWAIILGYKEQKIKKIVLLWVIPTFMIFLIHITLIILLIFAVMFTTINVK